MITDLPTKRIKALSPLQTFLTLFTYKMAEKINWHRYGTKSRHCHPMYTGSQTHWSACPTAETGGAEGTSFRCHRGDTFLLSSHCGRRSLCSKRCKRDQFENQGQGRDRNQSGLDILASPCLCGSTFLPSAPVQLR